MKTIKIFVILMTCTIFIFNVSAQSVWLEQSFKDFRDGTFLDAGSNAYVSAAGRIQMITRWDFNNDGNLDILLTAGHGHTEKENTYIYLNNGQDIDASSRIELPAAGSYDGTLADLNKDGYNDLIVVNYADSHVKRVPVWIYYGSATGFSPLNRVELPSVAGTSIAVGDFNYDSWPDLAIGCQFTEKGQDEKKSAKKSFIYWNSPQGFEAKNKMICSFRDQGAIALAAGDLDKDGIHDLIALTKEETYVLLSKNDAFADIKNALELKLKGNSVAIGDFNGDANPDIAVCQRKYVLILSGDGSGNFDPGNAIKLAASNPSDVAFADVDLNGLDDVVVANHSDPNGATWTNSFVYYSNGKDFSTNDPLRIPTLGASGVNCQDLNQDGYPEIVFSFERTTYQSNINSYVYWNEKGSFFFENHTQLPTQGALSNAIGDVNNDGLPDIVFFNNQGYYRDGPSKSHIYWGDGTRGFSVLRRTEFKTHQVFGHGHADLDDDGDVDLVFARKIFVVGINHKQAGLILHWNEDDKYQRSTPLTMTFAYGGVRIADINKDGYLDILAGGTCLDLNNHNKYGFPIFWGSQKGFSFKKRTVIETKNKDLRGPLLMDLNKDGKLDIAAQVEDGKVRFWWGNDDYSFSGTTDLDMQRNDHLMYLKAADLNKDGWLDLVCPQRGNPDGTESSSLIYYGSSNGFNNNNRTEVRSYVPYQNSIADLNKDGWLDLFLTSYGGEVSGNRPGLIYWGGEEGFKSKRTEIENYGGAGSEILDYDNDGWPDILIGNHRKAGSYTVPRPHEHTTISMLYWGGINGFSETDRWEVEVIGNSGLNLRDAGNSYDRGLYEDYISSVFEITNAASPSSIEWKADTPFGTSVKFQIKISDSAENLSGSAWSGPHGPDSWFEDNGSKIYDRTGKYLQYRARLISPNGAATPYLTEVKIYFDR